MNKLVVMVGAPGSGKSTIAKQYVEKANIVSRDDIRFSLLKDNEEYFSHEKEVFEIFVNDIKNSLLSNEITIADATHLNENSRTKLLRALGKALSNVEVVGVMVDTPLETCLERNEKRDGLTKVPRGVIRRMYYSMTAPTQEEGFNKVVILNGKEK